MSTRRATKRASSRRSAKKSSAKKTASKKRPAKKTASKKRPAKKSASKKSPSKKSASKRSPAKSGSAKERRAKKEIGRGRKSAGSASGAKRRAAVQPAKASLAKKAPKAAPIFDGFPPTLFKFLRELEKNNNRDWFTLNKPRYQNDVRQPLEAFVDAMEPKFGPGKVFRIYRDVRFSANKAPYKTNASAVFEKKGLIYYLHLEKDYFFCATGYYQMARDQLSRFYDAVVDGRKGSKLAAEIAAAEELDLEIGGSALKNVARGYPKEHPRARFLKHKGLTISRTFRPIRKWVHTGEVAERIAQTWDESERINKWLQKHVGPSEEGNRFVRR